VGGWGGSGRSAARARGTQRERAPAARCAPRARAARPRRAVRLMKPPRCPRAPPPRGYARQSTAGARGAPAARRGPGLTRSRDLSLSRWRSRCRSLCSPCPCSSIAQRPARSGPLRARRPLQRNRLRPRCGLGAGAGPNGAGGRGVMIWARLGWWRAGLGEGTALTACYDRQMRQAMGEARPRPVAARARTRARHRGGALGGGHRGAGGRPAARGRAPVHGAPPSAAAGPAAAHQPRQSLPPVCAGPAQGGACAIFSTWGGSGCAACWPHSIISPGRSAGAA
jgi:hypothetical protein